MLKEKQVLVMVSIVAASFLFGTMFNFATTVTGSSGSPWDKVWTAISGLESRVETLEQQSLPQGYLGSPAYDSGWIDVTDYWFPIWHGLNTTEDVFVCVIRNDSEFGVNQAAVYGVTPQWLQLSENEITVRVNQYSQSISYDKVRVMIWKISEPPT